MFAPFLESFLTRNGHIRTTGIIGTSMTDHSRIIAPGMHEDILRGNDVATTVQSGVATRIADKDGIWRAGPSNIGMAATHANPKILMRS